MVFTGYFNHYKTDTDKMYKCAQCSQDMGAPFIYERSFPEFDTKLPEFVFVNFEKEMEELKLKPSELIHKIFMEATVQQRATENEKKVISFGLMNECLNCGNRPTLLLKQGGEVDQVKPITGGCRYIYNDETKEVKLVDAFAKLDDGFRYLAFYKKDLFIDNPHELAQEWFKKEFLPDILKEVNTNTEPQGE